MALPVWPTSLPKLKGLANSAGSDQLHPPIAQTQFDDGPDRQRRRSLFVVTPLNMTLVMSAAQFVAFKAFHLDTLNAGTKKFTGPVLLPNMTVGNRTCWIDKGKVSWKPLSPTNYQVAFVLVVQDW